MALCKDTFSGHAGKLLPLVIRALQTHKIASGLCPTVPTSEFLFVSIGVIAETKVAIVDMQASNQLLKMSMKYCSR